MDLKSEQALGERAAHILYPLFVGQFFGIIFTALTFIVVARLLMPFNYGLYVFAFGFSTLVNGFAGFGVGAYFSNIIAKYMYNRDGEGILRALWSGYIIAGTVGLILTLFGIGISGWVAGIFTNVGITPQLLQLASTTIVFVLINTISVSALIGFSRSGLGAITTTVVDVIQLLLSYFLTIQFGVSGAISAMLIGYIIGAILGTFFVLLAMSRHIRFRFAIPPVSHVWKIFLYVSPIAWTNFLNTGMQSFTILFLGFVGVTTVGLGNFGAATRGLTLLTMIYSALGSGLFPIFTAAKSMATDGDANSTYNKIIRFAILLMLPVMVFVAVLSLPGVNLLVGGSYVTAPSYLTLMAIGTAIALFGTFVNNLLISEGFTGVILKVNLISAIVQLLLMLTLVPHYYILGAIFVIFFVGNIIEAILFALQANKLFGIRFEYAKLALLYIASTAFGFVLAALIGFVGHFAPPSYTIRYVIEIAAGVILTLFIYPIILVAMRAINWHDIKSMRHATMRLGRISFVFSTFFNYSEFLYRILIGM